MVSRQYRTPEAFRMALEQRQRERAASAQVPLNRVSQIDLYFRFLDRVIRELGDGAVVLKGGLALELRLGRARTTLDIDLRASGSPPEVYAQLRAAGLRDHGDFLRFVVEESKDPEIAGEGVVYEGRRFKVQAMLANRPYLRRFGLDVAFGDAMVGAPELMIAPDALSFMGIPPPQVPLYPLGTHIAEKLHAYTQPTPNSRLKDLIDLGLIAVAPTLRPSSMIDAQVVRESLRRTFDLRATHPLPGVVPPPPAEWEARYPKLQRENRLAWASLAEVRDEVCRFLDPILDGSAAGVWNHAARRWGVPAVAVMA